MTSPTRRPAPNPVAVADTAAADEPRDAPGLPAPPLTTSSWPPTAGPPLLDLTVGQALREAAAEAPGTVALVEGVANAADRRRWTYAEVLEQSEGVARSLLTTLAPGDRLAVWAPNLPEWVLLEFGAALAGVTLVTVNPALRADELRHVLGHSRANAVFMVPEYRGNDMVGMLRSLRPDLPGLRTVVLADEWDAFVGSGTSHRAPLPDPSSDDPAQIQYTSGTTGTPKGATLHHRGVVNNTRLYADRFGLPVGGVQISAMPLFHTAGCVLSVMGALAVRGTLVLPPAFDPALVLTLLEEEGAEALLGVPTMLLALLENGRFGCTDLSRLRRVMSGGAVVPPDLVRRAETEMGAVVNVAFAQTEASPVITQTAPGDALKDRTDTLGRPLPHTEVRIVDPARGGVLPVGVVGELVTRGYHVMTGYHNDPAGTAAAIDDDGWLHTGDLASMDERGYCRIEGRLKDMIIRGGENIYPREIEMVLFSHPDVADVAVVGVPSVVWGEQVAAFVRMAAGRPLDPTVLAGYCRERLAPHKTPQHWVAVESFPLTGSGKVRKYALRDSFVATRGTEGVA